MPGCRRSCWLDAARNRLCHPVRPRYTASWRYARTLVGRRTRREKSLLYRVPCKLLRNEYIESRSGNMVTEYEQAHGQNPSAFILVRAARTLAPGRELPAPARVAGRLRARP